MQTSYANEKPSRLEYMPLPDGQADVWLRINIREEQDEDGGFVWAAEENYFRTAWTREYIEEHFDELLEYDPTPVPEPSTEELLLEMAADHEMRICLIEMGVTL